MTFTFNTPQIETPRAGDSTAQVEGYARAADGGLAHYMWEGARDNADSAALELLESGLVEQASIKMWVHDWNLPGALPLVRAHICGMDNATLDDSGQLVRTTINIW